MTLSPNLTLLIQMGHFLLAYWLINRFLLTPGYKAVKADDDRLRQLNTLISDESEGIQAQLRHRQERLEDFKRYYRKKSPQLVPEIRGLISAQSMEKNPRLTEKEMTLHAEKVSQSLKEKMLP